MGSTKQVHPISGSLTKGNDKKKETGYKYTFTLEIKEFLGRGTLIKEKTSVLESAL